MNDWIYTLQEREEISNQTLNKKVWNWVSTLILIIINQMEQQQQQKQQRWQPFTLIPNRIKNGWYVYCICTQPDLGEIKKKSTVQTASQIYILVWVNQKKAALLEWYTVLLFEYDYPFIPSIRLLKVFLWTSIGFWDSTCFFLIFCRLVRSVTASNVRWNIFPAFRSP